MQIDGRLPRRGGNLGPQAAACCERLPWLRAADGLGQRGRIAGRRQLGQLIGSLRQALRQSAISFALGPVVFPELPCGCPGSESRPAAAARISIGRHRPKPARAATRWSNAAASFSRCSCLAAKPGRSAWALRENTQLFVDGFDLRRARTSPCGTAKAAICPSSRAISARRLARPDGQFPDARSYRGGSRQSRPAIWARRPAWPISRRTP